MKHITNWRYEKWINNKDNYEKLYSEDEVSDYISWEIYPEDIELFITVLAPRTIIYKNCVVICKNEKREETLYKMFDSWLSKGKEKHIAQAQINLCSIADIFLNNSDDTSPSTIKNLAELIKNNWELHLNKLYPDRNFEFEISGEGFDTFLTFFEI